MKNDHLKPYQFKSKRPEENDHETMRDMIVSGTDPDSFMLFWHKEAGYKLSSLKTMYYRIKDTIDNGIDKG